MTIYDVTNGSDDSKFLHQLKSYNKIPLLVHLHKFLRLSVCFLVKTRNNSFAMLICDFCTGYDPKPLTVIFTLV